MKKLTRIIMTLVAAFLMMACSHSGDMYDAGWQGDKRQAEYSSAFVGHFGTVAENHDWGFGVDAAATRGVNVNGNIWYQNWERPVNVTDAEKAKVVEEFSKVRRNAVNDVNIVWENFWVQQVYTGEQTYNDGFGQPIGTGSSHMNHLLTYNDNKVEKVYWPEEKTIYGGYEHDYNFNSGNNTTVFTDDVTGEKFIGTTLMENIATDGRAEQFGYHNSTDSKDHFEYIILEIDGAYYVGFDFYAHGTDEQPGNKNMDVERDWVFNDWIVKISPATHKISYAKRIICEDLGSTEDWDFNDVVFDALIDYSAGKTYIKILAAGGTMKLTVAGIDVHKDAFGVDDKTMVNTGIVSKPYKDFVISQTYNSYADIPVIVEDNRDASQFIKYELKHTIGAAPQKICVEPDYVWCSERASIDEVYPRFKDYVGNPNIGYDWYR